MDLIEKMQQYDPKVFRDEFEIVNPNELPDPEVKCKGVGDYA